MPSARPRSRPPADRRALGLIGGALLAVALGILIGWLLFRGDERRPPSPVATVAPPPGAAGAPARFDQFGLRFQRPAGWSTAIKQGVLNVAAPGSTVAVTVSMTQRRTDERAVRRKDRADLKRLFKAREVERRRYAVGPLPTLVTELAGTTRRGSQVRILSMAVSSRWRTYSVQVFSTPRPTRLETLQLQALIASFQFRRPR